MKVRLEREDRAFDTVVGTWRMLADDQVVDRHTRLEAWARAAAAADAPGTVWLMVEDDDGPLAVLHGLLEDQRRAGMTIRVLRNGAADGLLADRCTSAVAGELRRAVVNGLREADSPVDMMSFGRLREGGAFHRMMAGDTPRGTADTLDEEHRFGGYSVIDTDRPASAWFEAAGKNLRGSLRKARNRAGRQGQVSTTEARTPDTVAAAFDDYVELEAAGWKGATGGLKQRPVEHELLRVALREAAHADLARCRSLWVGDTLAASQLALVAGSTLVLLKVAYNEDLAALAPGNLLMEDLTHWCCDEPGITAIDLVTRQDWHARWHPTVHPTYAARYLNPRRPLGLVGRALPARLRP